MNHVPTPPNAGILAESSAQRWLLAHDIADPKRLRKVWRVMRKVGVPLQYSLYLLRGNRRAIDKTLDQLRDLIDNKSDDLRVYPLGENTRLWGLGTQFSDGGNTLTDELIDRLRRQVSEPEGLPTSDSEQLGLVDAEETGKPSAKGMNCNEI